MALKVALVTSQVTYMPDNYLELFQKLLQQSSNHICALVLLENLDKKTLVSAAGLPLLGAHRIGATLWRNILELPLKRRERLFGAYHIPTLSFRSMNDPEAITWAKEAELDLIINVRTRCLYREAILKTPRFGCLNIHHGLLPEYRGTLCDLYALTEGRPAGFSIHVMEKKVDNGPILKRIEVAQNEKNYLEYLSKTPALEAQALAEILSHLEKTNTLPTGSPNLTEKKVYTKNPTRKQIQSFRQRGFIL